MSKTEYRKLKEEEVNQLKEQDCSADHWDQVLVKPGFDPSRIHHCTFSGNNRLGNFSGKVNLPGGIVRDTGIFSASLHNCLIGDDCFISGVHGYIANYEIADGVIINNIERLYVDGETRFGNGESIAVLNEMGGREVLMYDRLSSHLGYILALYRHRQKEIARLNSMILAYADSKKSGTGFIGRNTCILNSGTICNVWVGEYASIDGVKRLTNGSVNSLEDDPVRVGNGVIADRFIFSSGSSILDATIIDKCFVGQSVSLGKHYSAENSLFFSNCVGYHGEACSVFAGPYTVSHHKSTLLISAYFSFLNAGSGSNQSNHMYKLGPLHQGIVERGSKTTSDSYLLWPARIGAFSLVMGRHYKNSDTTDLPFSYLIESNDESILVPAVNLQSVGTIRDAQKWPRRDRRKAPELFDLINFNLLSPFTIQKMIRGRQVLMDLKSNSGRHSDYFFYENCKIHRKALERGIELYTLGIQKFLGNSLLSRMEKKKVGDADELFVKLEPCNRYGSGEWVDLAGLFVPKTLIEDLLERIRSNRLSGLDALQKVFTSWHKDYYEMEWTWAKEKLEEEFGIPTSKLTSADVIGIIESWKNAVVSLDELLYQDAHKEFTLSAQTGFGVDGSEEDRIMDFIEVRGDFELDPAVAAIREHIEKKTRLGDEWIRRMS